MDDPYFDATAIRDELVTVVTYDDAVSARLAVNHLREAGLPAVISDENTVTMDWLLSNAIGGIKVQVDPKDFPVARRLIEEHERQRAVADGLLTLGAADGEEATVAVGRYSAGEDDVQIPEDDDEADEEPPPTNRERDGSRILRGALLGILFPPIELYVLYLVFKVFVSTERLGRHYRNMAWGGAIIMLIVLGGVYAFLRPAP
jgi:hypothetical protein